MSKVTFYTHVHHRHHFACKLVQTIQSKGQKLLIWLPDAVALAELDVLLWTFDAESFIAHGLLGHEQNAEVPVLLGCGDFTNEIKLPEVMLNLSEEYLPLQNQFERVLEIVEADEVALAKARVRFSIYRQAGFKIEHFNREGQL